MSCSHLVTFLLSGNEHICFSQPRPFPSPQNKSKHLEILWGPFQEDCLFFSALTFLGDESWQLEIRSWCYGYTWDQCDCPRESLLSSVFSLSLPFSFHSPFSTCFFPCNLSLNFENVKHKKGIPNPSLISIRKRSPGIRIQHCWHPLLSPWG